jgi:membrane-bound inhibitor of C-type lysozyme
MWEGAMRVWFLALIAVMAGLPVSPAMADGVKYVCADKTELTASFRSNPNSVALAFHGSDEQVTLPQVLSADGGRYAANGTEFWIKGNDASLTRGEKRTTCKS